MLDITPLFKAIFLYSPHLAKKIRKQTICDPAEVFFISLEREESKGAEDSIKLGFEIVTVLFVGLQAISKGFMV